MPFDAAAPAIPMKCSLLILLPNREKATFWWRQEMNFYSFFSSNIFSEEENKGFNKLTAHQGNFRPAKKYPRTFFLFDLKLVWNRTLLITLKEQILYSVIQIKFNCYV